MGSGGLVVALALAVAVERSSQISLYVILETTWLLQVWSLSVVTGILYAFTLWYLSVLVITDRRIMIFVQRGLFSSYALDLQYSNIQDSAYAYRHPLHYLFNYGALIVRSSPSAIKRFEAENIPNPRDVHHYINKLMLLFDEAKREGRAPELPIFKKNWKGKHHKAEPTA